MKYKKPAILLSYLVSIIIILVLLVTIDIEEVLQQVLGFGVVAFVGLILVNFSAFFLRALRWQSIISPYKDAFHIMFVGFIANFIFPARIGEFIRAYVLSTKTKLGKLKSLSTIIVDRVMDGLALLLLLGVAIIGIGFLPTEIYALTVIAMSVIVLAFLFFLKPKPVQKVLIAITGFHTGLQQKTEYFLQEIVEGSQALRNFNKKQAIIWVASIVLWLLTAFILWRSALEIGIPFTFYQALILNSVIGFSVMIPSAPGNIGTFEGAFVVTFLMFGFDVNTAIVLAIINRFIQTITVIVGGLYSVNALGVSLDVLKRKEEKTHETNAT
jgi:glycosyltransferase 2 family protein